MFYICDSKIELLYILTSLRECVSCLQKENTLNKISKLLDKKTFFFREIDLRR